MAPDLSALENFHVDGYAANGVPRNTYTIPDIVLRSPTIRKVRVLSIGAGVTGILNAYRIQKELENVEHIIYEKNEDIGGTWLENRYPGCACDIPSHAYTLPFALNPDWPRFFSHSPDIWAYLNKVCEVWGLRKYMNFNAEVIGAYWHQDVGQWKVKIKQTTGDGNIKLFEDHCHVLLHGTGILNNWKWPNVDGLDKFKGKIMHTANWPKDYQAEQWKNDRVAVIGSGASSIQTVPTMQPHVKHLDVFVRTGVWFVEIANNHGANHEYTDEQKSTFHASPAALVKHAKSIEDQVNGLWGSFYKNSDAQRNAKEAIKARTATFIKDQRLLDGFTPEFGIGCRRITPGDPYMEKIQEDNVDVHFTAVQSITEKGVLGEDGLEREVDAIVCATGFDVSYRPRFPIVGQRGIDLAEKWKLIPESYLGLMVPDFPNLVLHVGPTWPVENGSVMGPLWAVANYSLQLIKKIQTENICSIVPRQDVTDDFNDHCQEWIRHTVWTESCRSWYKNNETGRVNAVWPGSSLHYMETIETPRYEDMDIEYMGVSKTNRWAYLGMGYTRALVEKGDPSPYLNIDNIDPEWMKAVDIDRKEIIQARIKRLQDQLQKIEEEDKEAKKVEVEMKQ